MRTLKNYQLDSFSFYESVVASKYVSKKDPDWKKRISKHEATLRGLYNLYSTHFDANTLEFITAHGFNDDEKADFEKLYSYKAKVLQELKLTLTTTPENRANSTCQSCTISEVNSFDHYLPQNEFPEFIVNPLNLIPSCSTCNSQKNDVWRTAANARNFINLYLDELPDVEYLICQIDINLGQRTISASYSLNGAQLDPDLFTLIERHYNRLQLFRRFKENSDSAIVEFANCIKPYLDNLPKNELVDATEVKINLDRKFFGFNYWKTSLQSSLLHHPDFFDNLKLLVP